MLSGKILLEQDLLPARPCDQCY